MALPAIGGHIHLNHTTPSHQTEASPLLAKGNKLFEQSVKRGIFGPVITRVPDDAQSLRVWDAMEAFTTMDGFWELKRTRTEGPDFTPPAG